ncbi:MAG: transcriptional repressor [Succinivibrio sp.]|jgi:Fur family ferric uptake transcriptional regulator|nr:transcriptional repressor [Succinivibrio sp.]MBQ8477972.1 transcriptional repressor [Succinivibrio sp.]MCI5577385.1 transcriptional repressor [Succinivibrio sp.]MCI5639171.1 transcriptional repressor [Succinivibrio sp.]MCI6449239.1 transcriptional repressor [Succinivibrio sp.]
MDDNEKYQVATKLTDDTLRKLEASGLRMTTQRRHIIEILTSSSCTSPKELWYEAKEFVPDLGIATVYRLINRLEQIGVISKARNLGMQNVTPKLGTITDKNGKKYPNSYQIDKLEPLVKQGLIDKGVITKDKNVVLTLVGDKINITII